MHELAAVGGLAGAVACLADRLAGPAREWGPPAVVLAVMALMACGVCGTGLAAGSLAVAGACLWTALAGPRHCGRASAVVDLATMALLTAAAARPGQAGTPGHPSGMRMAGGPVSYDVRLFLFLVTCWVLARAAVRLAALVGSAASCPPAAAAADAAAGANGRTVLREAGSTAMVVAMAAMLA
ncbi:hypothetical protein [Streptomyces sp. NPDC049040]|uniref:hypothetical protein n=1 Tax=Streptomyces sp. NPDC049040 TaxID=3365593 RepID=UPI00371233CD